MKKIFLILQLILIKYALAQTTTLTSGGAGVGSWTVPCGVTTVTVKCWGGGGGGGGSTSSSTAGGGGGAGGYSTGTISTTAGQVFTYTVGAAGASGGTGNGTSGGNTIFSTIIANGGTFGFAGQNAGTGGTGGVGISGNGANGTTGGASTGGNGGAAVLGGAAQPGSAAGVNGVAGNAPGGGGGGSGIKSAGNPSGSAGGVGNVTISFVFPDVNAVASSTLASCTATSAALTATAITAPGWTGAWQCVGCTGITIANPASASTTASGFTPGSTSYFQWVATYTATGCSVYDDLNIAVPNCPITNNNCANATVLTVNAGLMCGQSTTTADFETGECYAALPTPNQGLAPQSLWYRITATNDSLVLNIAGYGTNGPPSILVFGPFAPGAGCLPACSSTVSVLQGLTVDPGVHTLLTGLATTGNHDYLIAVDGFGNANFDFCINMANPAINSTAPTNALVISNCGATYNGSTNGGYYPSGTSTGANNLDGNNSTTVAGASQTGDDVTFVVNNISWFKFCTVNAGTYNVQFDVLSCVFSGASSGSQMAILTGTSTNLTNIWQATNPTTPATAVQTSPSFALAAGGCAYLVVDGFAGDACSYSYVLNNITGGCILLPMELLSFNGIQKEQEVDLTWATGTEKNNDYFTIERSDDGINFKPIETVDGAGISSDVVFYSTVDKTPLKGISYYRLRQTDYNGRSSFSNIISVDYQNPNDLKFDIVPNPNQENAMSNIVLSNIPDKEVTVLITDMRGVNLYEITKKTDSNKIEIPNGFSNGIYFVKVICSDFVQTKRMIIK